MAKVKVTVIDKKCYPELQKKYCMDPDVGLCPMFEVGQEFIIEKGNGNFVVKHGIVSVVIFMLDFRVVLL